MTSVPLALTHLGNYHRFGLRRSTSGSPLVRRLPGSDHNVVRTAPATVNVFVLRATFDSLLFSGKDRSPERGNDRQTEGSLEAKLSLVQCAKLHSFEKWRMLSRTCCLYHSSNCRRYPISVVHNTRIAVWSLPGCIPPRNRPIHLSQFAKYLSVVVKTVAAGRDIRHSSGGCDAAAAADDGMSQPLAISFNPK